MHSAHYAGRGTGYVYLIRAGSECKVGVASEPMDRLNAMQTYRSERCELLGAFFSTRRMEAEVHKKFDRFRRRGEIFVYSEEILEYFMVMLGRDAEANVVGGHHAPLHPVVTKPSRETPAMEEPWKAETPSPSDRLDSFVSLKLEFGNGLRCQRKTVRTLYETWCREDDLVPLGPRRLAEALRLRGVSDTNIGIGGKFVNGWNGVRIRP